MAIDPGPPAALVVVEVRWRADRDFGLPEETVDHRKRVRVRAAAYGLHRPRHAARTERRSRDCRCGSTSSSSSPAGASGTTGTPCRRRPDRPARPVLHSRPVRGSIPSRQTNARATRRGAHTRTVPTGTVPARRPGPAGPRRRGPRRNRTDRRSLTVPSVSMRQLLEAGVHFGHQTRRWNPKMKPVHLRRAQRDPHHRPGPDRPAPRRRARVRPRDRRPRRPGPVRRDQEAGPGAGRPGGDPRQPAVRQQALARRHAHQLRDDQEADRPARAARGPPGRTATSSG